MGSSRLLGKLFCEDINISDSLVVKTLNTTDVTATSVTTSGLTVNGNATTTGTLNVGNSQTNGKISINGKVAIRDYGNSWLGINDGYAGSWLSSGIYFGKSTIRTDAAFQLGENGNKVLFNTSSAKFSVPVTINNSLAANNITATNVTVNDTLKAFKYDLNTIQDLGGEFCVAPTIYIQSGATVNVSKASATTITVSILDKTAITSDSIQGVRWAQNSKIKFQGKIDGLNIRCSGIMAAKLNTTANTMSLTLTVESSIANHFATAKNGASYSDISVMLYQRYGKKIGSTTENVYSPVGIRMSAIGNANSAPYVDIWGSKSNSDPDTIYTIPSVRLGYLDGLKCGTYDCVGYGLYADNVYLKGTIISNSGTIGGFKIGTNDLSNGTWGTDQSVLMSTGTTENKAVGGSDVINGWCFTAGSKFGVTKNGNMYASNANISGKVTATSGTIGGFNITDSSLYTGSKSSFDNKQYGIFMGKDGQVIFGNNDNYLKYYKNSDGHYKVGIKTDFLKYINDETSESGLFLGDVTLPSYVNTWVDDSEVLNCKFTQLLLNRDGLSMSIPRYGTNTDTNPNQYYVDAITGCRIFIRYLSSDEKKQALSPLVNVAINQANSNDCSGVGAVLINGIEASGQKSFCHCGRVSGRYSSSLSSSTVRGISCHGDSGSIVQINGRFSHSDSGGISDGDYCHASCGGETKYTEYGFATGKGTVANGSSQTVIGKLNIVDTTDEYLKGKYVFIIGNGLYEEETDHSLFQAETIKSRSNAFTVDWDGNTWAAGSITATGSVNGTDFNGFTINKSVPSDAKFTDTVTVIENSCDSDSTTSALSAAQGKSLKTYIGNVAQNTWNSLQESYRNDYGKQYNTQVPLLINGNSLGSATAQLILERGGSYIRFRNDGSSFYIMNGDSNSWTNYIQFFTDGTVYMPSSVKINSPGHLYIPSCTNAETTSAANAYISSDGNGVLAKTSKTSSRRFKDSITTDLDEELNPEHLYNIDVVQFKYKKDYFTNIDDIRYRKNMIGLIAENVYDNYKIAADWHVDEESGKVLVDAWNEQYIVPAMLKLIQEQHKEIEKLKQIIGGEVINEG